MPLTRNMADTPILHDEVSISGASSRDRASYIEELVHEMERLAVGRDLERLRDLLRLARQEARRRAFE